MDGQSRLAMLRKLVSAKPDDPFPLYGLAMELTKAEALDEAKATFARLVERQPEYLPTYLMFGNLLARMSQPSEAAAVYDAGIDVAMRAGDHHALGELRSARGEIDPSAQSEGSA